jgi:hypothetical protein
LEYARPLLGARSTSGSPHGRADAEALLAQLADLARDAPFLEIAARASRAAPGEAV